MSKNNSYQELFSRDPWHPVWSLTDGKIKKLSDRGGITRIDASFYNHVRHLIDESFKTLARHLENELAYSRRATVTPRDLNNVLQRIAGRVHVYSSHKNMDY